MNAKKCNVFWHFPCSCFVMKTETSCRSGETAFQYAPNRNAKEPKSEGERAPFASQKESFWKAICNVLTFNNLQTAFCVSLFRILNERIL